MRRTRWLLLMPLIVLAFALLACNTLTRLGARPQPTAAAAATATPSPGQTSLHIGGGPVLGSPREARVAMSEQISTTQQLAPEQYDAKMLAQVGKTFTYTVTLKEERKLLWNYVWCATSLPVLGQNLAHMTVDFSVNGTPVDVRQFQVFDSQANNQECQVYAAVVYAWPAGATTLATKVTFVDKINDGFSDYPPGSQTYVYTVTRP
jgi:hypothetical protein